MNTITKARLCIVTPSEGLRKRDEFEEAYQACDTRHSRGDQWRAAFWISSRSAEDDFCCSVRNDICRSRHVHGDIAAK